MKQIIKRKLKILRSRIMRKAMGRYGFAILCDTRSGSFAVDPDDLEVGASLLRYGGYADEELDRIKMNLSRDSSVLIVGTHIGALLVPIAKQARQVCGVEANPDTHRLLMMNVALNHLTNVRVALIAASDKREQLAFLKCRLNSGGSKRMPRIYDERYFAESPETITVEAYPLDEYFEEDFDHIIMDIEGSEVFALRGMPRILAHAKTLQIEFLPHHLRHVAGCSVAEFLAPISPHFHTLTIPSKNKTVSSDRFLDSLQAMYDSEEGDDGLIFRKDPAGS